MPKVTVEELEELLEDDDEYEVNEVQRRRNERKRKKERDNQIRLKRRFKERE